MDMRRNRAYATFPCLAHAYNLDLESVQEWDAWSTRSGSGRAAIARHCLVLPSTLRRFVLNTRSMTLAIGSRLSEHPENGLVLVLQASLRR